MRNRIDGIDSVRRLPRSNILSPNIRDDAFHFHWGGGPSLPSKTKLMTYIP